MGNFIEGTFRAHGTYERIREFILEAFEPSANGWYGEKAKTDIVECDGELFWMECQEAYLSGTERQFVRFKDNPLVVFNGNPDKEDSDWYMFVCDYLGQWEIDYEGMARLAKEYGVCIKVNAYGCNTMKEEILEVNSNGEVTKYHIETYRNTKDWVWYCPMPNLGG